MITPQVEIIAIAILVSLACSLSGVFLVLRKTSLMSDAISHSVLAGIVVAFLMTKDVSSPLVVVGAVLTGLFTVFLTELIMKTRRVKEDASIGLVFPALFSIGVILINLYASDVHIDTDAVLLGEIAFAPFNRLYANGMDLGPRALWAALGILSLNLLFIKLFYKELKLTTFDPGLANSLGFAPILVNYGLMSLVSVTAVGAFDVVGSILVVALMIAPPSTAYLLTKRLSTMIIFSLVIGAVSAFSGYILATILDASISGSMATASGIIFFLAVLFAPERGVIEKIIIRNDQRIIFASHMLCVHLFNHEDTELENVENTAANARKHMKWSEPFAEKVIFRSKKHALITADNGRLKLTDHGRKTARSVITET